jgi:hypothetical protein
VQVAVLFHGATRLNAKDVRLFRQFPAERLQVAAVSATLAHTLEQDLGRPVRTVRIALDPQAFCQQLLGREQARQALGLPEGAPVLGAVGRLVESKGFAMLIEAFAEARARMPGAQLAIWVMASCARTCRPVPRRWGWPTACVSAAIVTIWRGCIRRSTGCWCPRARKGSGWYCRRRYCPRYR